MPLGINMFFEVRPWSLSARSWRIVLGLALNQDDLFSPFDLEDDPEDIQESLLLEGMEGEDRECPSSSDDLTTGPWRCEDFLER